MYFCQVRKPFQPRKPRPLRFHSCIRTKWKRYEKLPNKEFQVKRVVCCYLWCLCPQKMETSFQSTTMMEVQMEGVRLAHKTPPSVAMSPTQTSLMAKVAVGRQQSLSPVRHVKAPMPTPVRWVFLTISRLQQVSFDLLHHILQLFLSPPLGQLLDQTSYLHGNREKM